LLVALAALTAAAIALLVAVTVLAAA